MQFTNDRTGETANIDVANLGALASEFATLDSEGRSFVWFWVAKRVAEHRSRPQATKQHADMRAFLADSFLYAIGMGLKKPMIRLTFGGWRYKVYLSAKGTVCFKTGRVVPGTSDPVGDEEYMGCLYGGKFLPPGRDQYGRPGRKLTPENEQFLAEMGADPVGFLAKCSKDMCRCCYCNLPLEDARSKDVGYGPVCAAHWGLPWGKSYDEKVPSFADLWGRSTHDEKANVRGMCDAIRRNPKDETLWGILGDALEEAGFQKRPTAPKSGVVIPSV